MYFSKKSVYSSLILIPVFVFLLVQCKTIQKTNQLNFPAVEEGLLWQISGDSLTNESYIFGTIHMIPAENFFLPEGTEDAFNQAQTLFLEVDMSGMDDIGNQMDMLQKALMKDNISLKELISAEDYKLVKTHFDEMGIPLFLLEKIKPLFLTVFADKSLIPGKMDEETLKFYELEFMDMAKKQNKKIKGLEEIDYQMALMDSIPYDEQANMLVESIKAGQEGSSEMDTLIQLYIDQQIGALYWSFATDGISKYDSLLLINRNLNWIPVMTANMKTGSCFFAVGAAHLAGPNGVIALLRDEGFELRVVRE